MKPLANAIFIAAMLVIAACAPTSQTITDGTAFALLAKPYEIGNPRADFEVLLWSESKIPLFIGSYPRLKLLATTDAYLSLYAVSSSGKVLRLMANHPVQANQIVTIGEPENLVSYRLTPPTGTENFLLIGARQPLTWTEAADMRDIEPPVELALTPDQLRDGLWTALHTFPSDAWNTAVFSRRLKWPTGRSLPKMP